MRFCFLTFVRRVVCVGAGEPSAGPGVSMLAGQVTEGEEAAAVSLRAVGGPLCVAHLCGSFLQKR